MGNYQIILRNIKSIKELVFPFPERKGIYVLTGVNGCGKTSLLTALSRLGNKNAFSNYKSNRAIDQYRNASVEYIIPDSRVKYIHGSSRWVPSPKRNNFILSQFPFSNTKFITAAGTRFYTQEQIGNGNTRYTNASNYIREAMNQILGTTKFNDLQYITIGVIRGRQRRPRRDNKLYVIRNQTAYYSEQNFSLGERLLLNTLDELESVSPNTLVLIDEVELSLHPIAQGRFYDYLAKQAKDKDLAVLISTHSGSLIRHATQRYFLENEGDGLIKVHRNCYPAYILQHVASHEEHQCDFYFFVEDDMAEKYFRTILKYFRRENNLTHIYAVEPVGGYDSVIKFVQNISSMGIPKQKAQAVLDADASDSYHELQNKGNDRTPAENKKYELFQNNRENISYLSITPELGIWLWLEQNKEIFKTYFENEHGGVIFDVAEAINQTSIEESVNIDVNATPAQLRAWAKGCFMNFKERIHNFQHSISEEIVVDNMIECYVKNTYNNDNIRALVYPLINR